MFWYRITAFCILIYLCGAQQPCNPNPCVNGDCLANGGGYTCACNSTGYTGDTCETDIDECTDSDLCGSQGKCENTNGSYTCDCNEPWFKGDDCSLFLGLELYPWIGIGAGVFVLIAGVTAYFVYESKRKSKMKRMALAVRASRMGLPGAPLGGRGSSISGMGSHASLSRASLSAASLSHASLAAASHSRANVQPSVSVINIGGGGRRRGSQSSLARSNSRGSMAQMSGMIAPPPMMAPRPMMAPQPMMMGPQPMMQPMMRPPMQPMMQPGMMQPGMMQPGMMRPGMMRPGMGPRMF